MNAFESHPETVRTLAGFVAETGEQGPAAESFANETARTLRIDVDGGVWLTPGAAVAYRGEIRFERLPTLGAIGVLVGFLWVGDLDVDPSILVPKRWDVATTRDGLAAARATIGEVGQVSFEADELEPALRGLAEDRGWKAGDLFMAIRVAVTGRTATPPLFDTLVVLGRDRVLGRLDDKRWARVCDEINEFEAQQRDHGTMIVKLFFHVTAERQAANLQAWMEDPWLRHLKELQPLVAMGQQVAVAGQQGGRSGHDGEYRNA